MVQLLNLINVKDINLCGYCIMSCCCYCEDDVELPKKEVPKTTSKLIVDGIMKISDCHTTTFNVIIFSFEGERFFNLVGSGFLLVQVLLNSNFAKHKLIKKPTLYRIFCFTTSQMIFTNHEPVIGPIEKLDASYLLSL